MRRALALLLLVIGLAPGTWLRTPPPPQSDELALRFVPVSLPDTSGPAPQFGALTFEGAWIMESPHSRFGGFSALVAMGGETLMALSDSGMILRFPFPGSGPSNASSLQPAILDTGEAKSQRDIEAATRNPGTGMVWIALENANTIRRGLPSEAEVRFADTIAPPQMADWGVNSGPEAMVRLTDGRFIVLREGFSGWFENREHAGLLFPDDPVDGASPEPFTFVGAPGFRPTAMTQLPDGRVLVLMRRLTWPLPARFAARLMVGDPERIEADGTWRVKEVAKLTEPLPIDNFEGLAVTPGVDGAVTVWMISDDNFAAFQHTVLLKFALDPA